MTNCASPPAALSYVAYDVIVCSPDFTINSPGGTSSVSVGVFSTLGFNCSDAMSCSLDNPTDPTYANSFGEDLSASEIVFGIGANKNLDIFVKNLVGSCVNENCPGAWKF